MFLIVPTLFSWSPAGASLLRAALLGATCLLLTTALPGCRSGTETEYERPNVVMVITDDQGYGDFSVYGNPALETPELDSLHHESVRLTNFHVAPVCTPTRSQLMTGIDALHNGSFDATGQRFLLDRSYTLLPEVFQENGYATALYGKWHLGGNFYGYRPHERGFDDAVHVLRGGHWSHPNPWNADMMDDTYYHNGARQEYEGYATHLWFDLGRQFVREAKKKDQPFFLELAITPPHLPWHVPERYREPYLNQGLSPRAIQFFAMIAAADEQIGAFSDFLKKEGEWENTIFVFFPDNGSTLWQQEFNAGMRGKKGSEYEGGHRVPLFVSWPNGDLGEPRDIDALTQVQDLFPTLLDLAGLELQEEIPLDGTSLAPLLRKGDRSALRDRILVAQNDPEKFDASVMWKQWRLVNGDELYTLEEDFAQQDNVAEAHPEIVDTLRSHYEDWWTEARVGGDPEPYFIGANDETVQLTAYDWYGGRQVYNWPHLRRGEKENGHYLLQIEEGGRYRISLRRWPRESGAGIREGVPPYKPFDTFGPVDDDYTGPLPAGKALDIRKARIEIAGTRKSKAVEDGDEAVSFEVDLDQGRTTFQTWFVDGAGTEFGAYYIYIEPLS